jgi:hypothetical protein
VIHTACLGDLAIAPPRIGGEHKRDGPPFVAIGAPQPVTAVGTGGVQQRILATALPDFGGELKHTGKLGCSGSVKAISQPPYALSIYEHDDRRKARSAFHRSRILLNGSLADPADATHEFWVALKIGDRDRHGLDALDF